TAIKKENKMAPLVSRGFRVRRAADVDPARVPPGQYVTRDFPVLSAGPTPHTALELWDFSVVGELDEPRGWTWANAGVSEDKAGLAAGLLNTGQQLGAALGLAILSALATAHTN